MLLSICIGTYNRISQIVPTVKNILCCNSYDFEVVVLDNCSSDGTFESLLELSKQDSRLKVFQNKVNIGGIKNPCKVLTLASGKYSLQLLDKDRINSGVLSSFLDFLRNNELSHGFCSLDKEMDDRQNLLLKNKLDSIKNTAYLSKHPSGNFYRTELYKKCKVLSMVLDTDKFFAFYSELINAEIAANSDLSSGIYMGKLIKTESLEECEKHKSHTYNQKNFFATPMNRAREYKMYLVHSKTLELEKKELQILCEELVERFIRNLISAKDLLNNEKILEHYGVTFEQFRKSCSNLKCAIALFYFFGYYIFLSGHFFIHSKTLIKGLQKKIHKKFGKYKI